MKRIALKAATQKIDQDSSDCNSIETLNLLTRKFGKFLKKKSVPAGLNMEQLAVFVDYRLRHSTMVDSIFLLLISLLMEEAPTPTL